MYKGIKLGMRVPPQVTVKPPVPDVTDEEAEAQRFEKSGGPGRLVPREQR